MFTGWPQLVIRKQLHDDQVYVRKEEWEVVEGRRKRERGEVRAQLTNVTTKQQQKQLSSSSQYSDGTADWQAAAEQHEGVRNE